MKTRLLFAISLMGAAPMLTVRASGNTAGQPKERVTLFPSAQALPIAEPTATPEARPSVTSDLLMAHPIKGGGGSRQTSGLTFSRSCTDAAGRTWKHDEPGFQDCASEAARAASRPSRGASGINSTGSAQDKAAAGFRFKFGD